MAADKYVLMLQEGLQTHPVDYRDIIVSYADLSVIPYAISKIVRATAELVYNAPIEVAKTAEIVLDRIDLGDVAAENEIRALSTSYFVRTPQFLQAQQGHARLVIGRKGSGKTALFYGTNGVWAREIRRGVHLEDHNTYNQVFRSLITEALENIESGVSIEVARRPIIEQAKRFAEKYGWIYEGWRKFE